MKLQKPYADGDREGDASDAADANFKVPLCEWDQPIVREKVEADRGRVIRKATPR
jgi:hypothetical protein